MSQNESARTARRMRTARAFSFPYQILEAMNSITACLTSGSAP